MGVSGYIIQAFFSPIVIHLPVNFIFLNNLGLFQCANVHIFFIHSSVDGYQDFSNFLLFLLSRDKYG